MKIKMKIVALCMLTAVLLAMWLPNLIVGQTAFAEDAEGGSTIAGVDVSDLKGDNLIEAVQVAVTNWTTEPVIVSGGGVETTIDPALFSFNVQTTIDSYNEQVSKPWFAFWEKKPVVHIPLQVTVDEQVKRQIEAVALWKTDDTYNQVLLEVSYLKEHEVEATVVDLSILEAERIALSMETVPADAIGVDELAAMLNDLVISPKQSISLLQKFGAFADATNQQAQDFVASVVYHTLLQTDYEILERHSQNRIPSYLQAGIEATVNKALQQDLQFISHSDVPSKYKATVEGGSFKLELTAQVANVSATPRVVKDKIVKPKLITRFSPDLAYGGQKVVQTGEEGLRVLVYRSITENGSTRDELVSRDYYPAINRIILKSSRELVTTTDTSGNPTTPTDNELDIDLNGDGIPDSADDTGPSDTDNLEPGQTLPDGSYYDKGGNLVTP